MVLLTPLDQYTDLGLLALRVALGAIFIVHGRSKWPLWPASPTVQMPANLLNIMKLLAIVEPIGGLAVLVGFLTQWAALGLGVIMVGALTMKIRTWHVPFMAMDKMGWEFDLINLAACIALVILGGGALAVDAFLL